MSKGSSVPGVVTGKISELFPLDPGKQCHLLAALARGAEELNSGKGWPDGVLDLMADLGRISGVNRVWLFQVLELSEKHMLMNFPLEWVDEHTPALKKMGRYDTKHWDFETCSSTYRTLVESRRRREWQTAIIHELDECDFKEYQMDQGVQSTVSMPVMVQGEWWGLLGLDDCMRPHQWNDEEIALVRMTAHLISTAVLRKRLNSANRQFDILSSLTESSAWELDFRNGYCWCSSKIFSNIRELNENVYLSFLQLLRRVYPQDRVRMLNYLRRQVEQGERSFRQDLRILRDKEYVWIEVIAKISLDDDGQMRKMAGIVIDIPERKKEEETLLRKATLDSLTGIANRGLFDSRLVTMVNELKEKGNAFSLLLLDVDHFKRVNDTWGHDVGDKALKHVTHIMQRTLREGDFVARFGGEEFAMLLPFNVSDIPEKVAERIRRNIENETLVTPEATIPLTVSIGVFNVSKECADLDCKIILNRADKVLYEAKRGGRNRIVVSGR